VNPTMSDGKHKALLWVIGANHNQFNSAWASETPPGTAISRSDQERVTRVHLGALAQALLLRRPRYLAVLRDHAVTAPRLPPGTDLVSQYQDPRRVFLLHNQEAVGAPQTEALNSAGQDQDLTVEISSGSRTAAMRVSSLHRLLYPDLFFGAGKTVMQSLRLPLRDLVALGIPAQDLRSISFVFDRTAAGVVYVGDVQLSD
jgi:hypothetical protein